VSLFLRKETDPVKTLTKTKTLKYENTVLLKSNKIINTSNGNDKIIYSTTSGVREYDINTGQIKLLNPVTNIKGLAYDKSSENYLLLDGTGKLYNLGTDGVLTLYANTQTTYKKLYDTQTGYYLVDENDNFAYIGGYSSKNIGDYGNIQVTIA